LVYRARSGAEVAFRSELDWLAKHRGVHVVYLLGPRADRPSWLPQSLAGLSDVDALRRIAPQTARSHVYVCGPDAWTEAARTAAFAAGARADHLHTEQFAW
jgi:ferredoxin-NADP reductase